MAASHQIIVDQSFTVPLWRCLRTKPKCEHLAAQALRHIEDVSVFCPRVRHQKATRRGKVWFVEALFPGYIFAKFNWLENSRSVLAASNVSGVVRFGQQIAEVPEALLQPLQESFLEQDLLTVVVAPSIGDTVEIAEGPFRGQSAVVTRILPSRERVAVLLEFMGNTREFEVPILSILGLQDARYEAAGIAA